MRHQKLDELDLPMDGDDILKMPNYYDDIIETSHDAIDANKNIKLIFIDTKPFNYIVWGNEDMYDDIFELQILQKSKQVINFGYEGRPIPEGIGLSFLKNYTFKLKKDIPADLFENDYFDIKINRDADGNIVPNRKISIIKKSQKLRTFDKTIDILLTKFNPIDHAFFLRDMTSWFTDLKEYTYDETGSISVV